jgi:hypothetical protein
MRKKHESYAMIGISRRSSTPAVSLFGSSIRHGSTIVITINAATVERQLNSNYYYGHEGLIAQVEMSAAQFATFVTTPNVGDGVPCTLRYARTKEFKKMENPPFEGQNEVFKKELEEDFKTAMKQANEARTKAEELLSQPGPMKVKDKKELAQLLLDISNHINSNMTFLHKQFARAMEKTLTAAKAEIEEFYTSAMMRLGKKAIEDSEDSPSVPKIGKLAIKRRRGRK